MATRPHAGDHVVIWRCSDCGRWEGDWPSTGCCRFCGRSSEPEQWALSVIGKVAPDPPRALVERILSEPRGKPYEPPPGIKRIPIR